MGWDGMGWNGMDGWMEATIGVGGGACPNKGSAENPRPTPSMDPFATLICRRELQPTSYPRVAGIGHKDPTTLFFLWGKKRDSKCRHGIRSCFLGMVERFHVVVASPASILDEFAKQVSVSNVMNISLEGA